MLLKLEVHSIFEQKEDSTRDIIYKLTFDGKSYGGVVLDTL